MSDTKTTYASKLLDSRWQKKRLDILNRDGFTCQKCFTTDTTKTLHIHHKMYESYNPWETCNELLVTLCHECHGEEPNQSKRLQVELLKSFYLAGLTDCQIDLFARMMVNNPFGVNAQKILRGINQLLFDVDLQEIASNEYDKCKDLGDETTDSELTAYLEKRKLTITTTEL